MKFIALLQTLVLSLVCSSSLASPTQDLAKILTEMQSAQGQFVQTLADSKGNLLQSSEGRFAVKKPGKFLWQTESPFPQQLMSDGELLWLYDPDLEQATVSTINDKVSQTPAVLLSGDGNTIEKQYVVTRLNSNSTSQSFELVSRELRADFATIQASFNANLLSQMRLTDKSGNVTTFNFTRVVLNPTLDDAVFQFTPPAGTDIIHND